MRSCIELSAGCNIGYEGKLDAHIHRLNTCIRIHVWIHTYRYINYEEMDLPTYCSVTIAVERETLRSCNSSIYLNRRHRNSILPSRQRGWSKRPDRTKVETRMASAQSQHKQSNESTPGLGKAPTKLWEAAPYRIMSSWTTYLNRQRATRSHLQLDTRSPASSHRQDGSNSQSDQERILLGPFYKQPNGTLLPTVSAKVNSRATPNRLRQTRKWSRETCRMGRSSLQYRPTSMQTL